MFELLLVAALIALPSDSLVVGLSARLESDSGFSDQLVTAEFTVEAIGGEISFSKIEQIPLQDLQLIEASHSRTRARDESGAPIQRDRFRFTLKPLTIGMCYIQPFTLSYSIPGDTTERFLQTPFLEYLARSRPESGGVMLIIIITFIIIAVATVTGVFYSRRRRRLMEQKALDDRPRVVAEALERLKNPPRENLDRFHFEILRDFVREYYGTSGAITTCAGLKEALNRHGVAKMNDWLDETDRALFGRESSTEKLEMRRMRLKNFLREYKGGRDAS